MNKFEETTYRLIRFISESNSDGGLVARSGKDKIVDSRWTRIFAFNMYSASGKSVPALHIDTSS